MKKTINAFAHAGRGLLHSVQKERNFRIQFVCAIIAVVMGFCFSLSSLEWCVILLCIALVLSLEMINTAIERLCNMVHPEKHPAIRIIKDVSAGAVLIAAGLSFISGAIIFFPRIIHSLTI